MVLNAASWAFVVLFGVTNTEKALGKLGGFILVMYGALQQIVKIRKWVSERKKAGCKLKFLKGGREI